MHRSHSLALVSEGVEASKLQHGGWRLAVRVGDRLAPSCAAGPSHEVSLLHSLERE